MLEKCVLAILELNWIQRLGHKKTKLNICHHILTSSTQLQSRSFHVVERTRTFSKCQKIKYAVTCKSCKNTVFRCQICKFVGVLLPPSSSWLLKLPNKEGVTLYVVTQRYIFFISCHLFAQTMISTSVLSYFMFTFLCHTATMSYISHCVTLI